jgi:hypothetical protein
VLVWLPPPAKALAAPATAIGLSRPVAPEFCLPLGWGSKLVRLVCAREDTARAVFTGVPLRVGESLAEGCREARRLAEERADMDDCVVRWRGRTEGDDWVPAPALAIRSRYDRRDPELRRGVVLSAIDAGLPVLRGDLSGILDS